MIKNDTFTPVEVPSLEPWRELPAELADVIEPELPAVGEAIMGAISREVPEYARPFEGSFGRGVRTGVIEALRQFVALIRDPDHERGPVRDVYVGLGRGELRQGRALDSLMAAYRIGARVAWRQISAAAIRSGVEPAVLAQLAESIFAYIDEISATSAEGYAQARSDQEGERQRRIRELARLLLRDPPAEAADLGAAARLVDWRLPQRAAAVACPTRDLRRLSAGLGPGALAVVMEGTGCVIVPDPDGPGRAAELDRAARGASACVGPSGPLEELAGSWRLAQLGLTAAEAGALEAPSAFRVDDCLAPLLLFEGRGLVERIASARLAPFAELTKKARERMRETALAHLRHGGNAAAMARELHVHPQTARYRIARLRELLGDSLDDPDARFELELALRAPAA